MVHVTLGISVIIPMYNSSQTIVRALNSVLSQTCLPSEIIIVDDCSLDDSLSVAEKWAVSQKTPHVFINVIRMQNNSGPSCARNAGWQVATQPYVAFLDSDDTWHPEKLRIQFEYAIKNSSVMIIAGQRICVDENCNSLQFLPENIPIRSISSLALIFKNYFPTSSVMLKRNIDFRFTEYKNYCEDHYLWLQILFSGAKAVLIETPLAYAYKPIFGDTGLSGNLRKMEEGELDNYKRLYNDKKINCVLYVCVVVFSLFKYLLRLKSVLIRSRKIAVGAAI